MAAFKEAVAEKTDAIETDIHLTRDGVVVISHDPSLLRCFGVDRKIIDCDYSYIKTLRTLKEPHEPMPTLEEVVRFIDAPERKGLWLLLDIKLDNDPDDVIRLISETILSVNPSAAYWSGRIRLGVWGIQYVPLCEKYLPGFPITHICFNLKSAKVFMDKKVQQLSFNVLDAMVATSSGLKFVREAHSRGQQVYIWTVNDSGTMKWALYHGIDGVCTDDPGKFVRLREEFDGRPGRIGWKKSMEMLTMRVLAFIFGYWLRKKYASGTNLGTEGKAAAKALTPSRRTRENIVEEEVALLGE